MKRINTILVLSRLLLVFFLFMAIGSSALNIVSGAKRITVTVSKKTKRQSKSDAEFPLEEKEKEVEARTEDRAGSHLFLISDFESTLCVFQKSEAKIFFYALDWSYDRLHGTPIYILKRALLL